MKIRNIIIFFVLLLALLPFCIAVQTGKVSGSIGISSINDMIYVGVIAPYCGDNQINAVGEQCDGSNLGEETCESLGLGSGDLACTPSGIPGGCVFDTSNCAYDGGDDDDEDDEDEDTGGGGSSSHSGGGSSSCIENWKCGEWGECEDGEQTRTCEDLKKCRTEKIKPALERACSSEGESGDEALKMFNQSQETNEGFFSGITGAVIGGGNGGFLVPLLFIIIVIGLLIITLSFKKKVVSKQGSENVSSSEDVVTEDVENVLEGEESSGEGSGESEEGSEESSE